MISHNQKVDNHFGKTVLRGFLIFVFAIGMQMQSAHGSMRIAVTSHFQDREDCHRGFQVRFDDFDLGSALRQISDLSPEWTRRFLSQLKVGAYPPSKVARHCSINDETFASVLDMGYYICHNAIDIDQEMKLRALTESVDDEEMDRIYALLKAGKYLNATMLVPAALGIEVPDRVWEVAAQVGARLSADDFGYLPRFISDPKFVAGLGPFVSAVGKIESDDLLSLKNTVKKFNPENMALIDDLVSQLNVSLFEMIVNPAKMMELYRDPELTETVQRVRELMPVLNEDDLNAMLKVKKVFEETRGSGHVMKVLLKLPLDFIQKFTDIQLSTEDVETMRSLQGILDDPRINGAVSVVRDLGLFENYNNACNVLSKCRGDSLSVVCRDTSEQLCLELEGKGCHLVADVY